MVGFIFIWFVFCLPGVLAGHDDLLLCEQWVWMRRHKDCLTAQNCEICMGTAPSIGCLLSTSAAYLVIRGCHYSHIWKGFIVLGKQLSERRRLQHWVTYGKRSS